MSDSADLTAALAPVAAAFQRLGVRHYIGGSVASTIHGAVRSTMDVDVVCELGADQIEPFLAAFGQDFYVSGPAVRHAVAQRSCFNLIHLPTAYKVDVFVSRGRPFDQAAMARAMPQALSADDSLRVPVATPEDSVVAKLEWFRLGDESSQRQWDDVSRLVALHGPALDVAHMRLMAESVGVIDLLNRLLAGQPT
ncbi:MAG: hypothetical protein EBX35_13200 [Planctomycetia bacterium]|nr:hypothetical protein [Planctomycetia bacterium]